MNKPFKKKKPSNSKIFKTQKYSMKSVTLVKVIYFILHIYFFVGTLPKLNNTTKLRVAFSFTPVAKKLNPSKKYFL